MGQRTLSDAQLDLLLNQVTAKFLTRTLVAPGGPVTDVLADVTLYVRAGGDDLNDGLSEDTALATVQAAWDKIPKFVKHNVEIDIGPGSFTGFYASGYTVYDLGKIHCHGTLDVASPATGTVTGTATGGSTTGLADTGQSWTTNDLRGRLVLVGGEYRHIRSNTATTIEFIGALSDTASGKAYQIIEQKTVINSDSILAGWRVGLSGNRCRRSEIEISDLSITGGTVGISNWGGHGVTWTRVHTTGNAYGGHVQSVHGESAIQDCFFESALVYGLVAVEIGQQLRVLRTGARGASTAGFFMAGPGAFPSSNQYVYADGCGDGIVFISFSEVYGDYLFAEGNSGVGVALFTSRLARFQYLTSKDNGGDGLQVGTSEVLVKGTSVITGNGGYGVLVNPETSVTTDVPSVGGMVEIDGTCTVATNVSGGVYVRGRGAIRLGNVDGSNTGGYGVELTENSYGQITGQTGITGGSGDATIDGGSTTLTWAVNFASNGDSEPNPSNFCLLARED